MMRRGGVMVAVAMVLAVAACNQGPTPEPSDPPPSSGGLNPNNVPPPSMGPNGACNDLTPSGGIVNDQLGTSMPAMTGGTMTDGRYVLVRYEWYTPNQLHVRSITLMVTGGGLYGQYLWTRDQDPEQRNTVNIATNGAQIAMRSICPVGADLEWDQYAITDTGLTLYSSRDNKAAFFVRQ
jgi:hypothetical protein